MFGRATITFGIGPHCSFNFFADGDIKSWSDVVRILRRLQTSLSSSSTDVDHASAEGCL